ncbi:MAG: DNA mismatch repair endonuclease MutL [Nitrospirae bacterium]|nr:DNA mismatch repair endonuclease MutL [Nitrospirota bacterium]
MPSINILPLNLRNKIAAGEVVERPASVVKELMENSIDARSSRIEIDILKAGKRLIKVSDNGTGMDREDALLAFERYATSKIKDEDDLFNIRTMGFRGEAIASIASVSKVRMTTSLQNEVGTCIEIIGGDVKEVRDCPSIGTTIEIKDLFFNTPARRKFLKSDSTENYHIIDAVTREAIAHYQIGFVLRMDGEDAMNLPTASSHRERLVQIFGKDFVGGLLEAEAEDGQMSVKAFLGKATNLRNNRNNQFLFINNRPVKDQSVTYAVYKAYEELIPKDKHPVFFLFMGTNPSKVDFNVHPTKKEVRFEDKSRVFNFVYQAAKEALSSQHSAVRSNIEIEKIRSWEDKKTAGFENISTSQLPSFSASQDVISERLDSFYISDIPFLYLGDTLVAITENEGIMIIDYHAAHERINYERLLKRIDTISYKLLFPQQVKPQVNEYRVLLENIQLLNELGIEFEDFGHGTIIVRSLPEFLRDADLNALMSDMAAALINPAKLENEDLEPLDSVKKMLAAKLACHSSIRGKEIPDGIRIAQLLKDLDNADNPNTCPHGRPTRIFISMDELRKMFKK